jgi:hypothetical protein
MSSVLCVYDIPEKLRITNPSAVFRRYGFRANLSCWVFPQHLVPTEEIDRLKDAGAEVHMIEFAEKDQDKILELARTELKKHAKHMMKFVTERVSKLKAKLMAGESFEPEAVPQDVLYKKWRSVIATGKRELLAAEHCAFGFQIDRDVADALEALKNLLSSEFHLALAWRDQQRHNQQQPVLPGVS